MTRKALATLGLAAVMVWVGAPARAHESRPGYLELRQTGDETYDVLWKQPARGEMVLRLNPVLPESCFQAGEGRRVYSAPPRAASDCGFARAITSRDVWSLSQNPSSRAHRPGNGPLNPVGR